MNREIKGLIQAVLLWMVCTGLAHAAACGGHDTTVKSATACLASEDYQLLSPNAHKRGRWYLEVTLKGAATLQMLCDSAVHKGSGWQAYAGGHDRHESNVYRLALDLDMGRIYFGRDGKWLNGKPGVSGGKAVAGKGRYAYCGVISTQRIADLLARKALKVNFGEQPFAFDPPKSFKPFLARPVWIGGKDAGLNDAIDYSAIDLGAAKPAILLRKQFDAPQAGKDGYPYRTAYRQLEVDCSAMSLRDVLNGTAADAGYAVSADMQPGKPVAVAALGSDSLEGSAARTICFLKKNNFALPQITEAGKWESMQSPVKGVNIYDAPDQRAYRNGYVLTKVKNEFAVDLSAIGAKAGTAHIGYTAVACEGKTSHSILVAEIGADGEVQGGSFYNDTDATPSQPENRKRYKDACRAYLSNRQAYEKPGATRVAAASPAATSLVFAKHRRPARSRKVAAPRQLARRIHHAHKTRRYASRDKDLRYCLDKPNNEAIIACTENGDRGTP